MYIGAEPMGKQTGEEGSKNLPHCSRRSFLTRSAAALPAVAGVFQAGSSGPGYLFVYFRENGKSGAHFCFSRDGYRWEPLNKGAAVVKPEQPDELMRDPYLARGPDGFHMIWTWGWTTPRMGYAYSKDLVHWTGHREIPVMANVPGIKNVWAPEAYWDEANKLWMIVWSSTIEGRFPETAGQIASGYNHRIYSMTTPDFRTFSEPRVFFDPGYPVIDATILKAGARYYMIFKDERDTPLKKHIQLASGPALDGPWSAISAPFTEAWSEGPAALPIDGGWIVYYDHYRTPQGYRAVFSRDLKQWSDVSARVSFPPGARHGSFLKISAAEARVLFPVAP